MSELNTPCQRCTELEKANVGLAQDIEDLKAGIGQTYWRRMANRADESLADAVARIDEMEHERDRLERDLAMAMDAARKGDDARAILGGMQMDASNYDTNVAIVTQQRDQLERENAALRAALMTAGS